jgi:hypothetical protein
LPRFNVRLDRMLSERGRSLLEFVLASSFWFTSNICSLWLFRFNNSGGILCCCGEFVDSLSFSSSGWTSFGGFLFPTEWTSACLKLGGGKPIMFRIKVRIFQLGNI